jgi:prolyl-tRNA editing enzyme YbaK/EbsC (Cys-tRNA(Pro) deacylase)
MTPSAPDHPSLGSLAAVPVAERPELVGAPVLAALEALGLTAEAGVAGIDPALSDTAATQAEYGLDAAALVNCVIVGGRRDGVERVAALCVPSHLRADVNGTVKRMLDVRKASFLPRERAVDDSGMEFGGISPFGLPSDWPVLVEASVLDTPLVVIGSGVRASKLLLPGALLERIPSARIVDGLGLPAVAADPA